MLFERRMFREILSMSMNTEKKKKKKKKKSSCAIIEAEVCIKEPTLLSENLLFEQ
jgi:hypothetical protein